MLGRRRLDLRSAQRTTLRCGGTTKGYGVLLHLMGFDGNYVMAAAVTIRSLGQTLHGDESATIHVLGVDLTDDDRLRIERSTPPSLTLRWYDFDPQFIAGLPTSSISGEKYISQTAYTLLFLDRFLPSEAKTVLFLDADTLVRESPLELFSLDLEGLPIAVQDFGCCAIGMPTGVAGWRELDLDGRLPAFNTGVLVIDRHAWNANRVEPRSLEYLARFGSEIHYVDQDCLNASNAGDWLALPPRWNYQAVLE